VVVSILDVAVSDKNVERRKINEKEYRSDMMITRGDYKEWLIMLYLLQFRIGSRYINNKHWFIFHTCAHSIAN
jgi:hypothetical protein